jgi:hypothetical protein
MSALRENRLMSDTGEVTRPLLVYREGDRAALDRLVPVVYGDLRRIALAREAYLRLVDQTRARWEDPAS